MGIWMEGAASAVADVGAPSSAGSAAWVTSELRRRLAAGGARGAHAALALLNGRTRHRFTGVYRLDPPMLRSVCLYDRENPELCVGGDAPLRETYCSLVAAADAPLTILDAPADPRAEGHPARHDVLAYCGAPIHGDDGLVLGTLCHFDVRPRLAAACDAALLAEAARLFAPILARPHAAAG